MKVFVDEMYPATVAEALRTAAIDATTVTDLRLAGASDPELFGAASSRFSRRPAGLRLVVAAIRAIADEEIEDRL